MERLSAFAMISDSTPVRCNIAETLLGLKNSSVDSLAYESSSGDDGNEEGFVGAGRAREGSPEEAEAGSESQGSRRLDGCAEDLCKCKKSRCLKLYCVCFTNRQYCSPACKCVDCANSLESRLLKEAAEAAILERNPEAFDSKFKPSQDVPVSFHKHGCK